MNALSDIGAFHHIGIATEQVDLAQQLYKSMGYALYWSGEDPLQEALIVLLKKKDHPLIELIQPLSNDSPVSALLKRQGAGAFHTCYEVNDIDHMSTVLRKNKMIATTEKMPAVAFGGKNIRFFYSDTIGLLELVEK